jgi:predicted HicB family RNase H-like nuclease
LRTKAGAAAVISSVTHSLFARANHVGLRGQTIKLFAQPTCCKELGQEPCKPYSGNLMLRILAEIHAAVAAAAEASGKSINQWAAAVLASASHV